MFIVIQCFPTCEETRKVECVKKDLKFFRF